MFESSAVLADPLSPEEWEARLALLAAEGMPPWLDEECVAAGVADGPASGPEPQPDWRDVDPAADADPLPPAVLEDGPVSVLGPTLAAVDPAPLDAEDLVDLARGWNRLISMASAGLYATTAALLDRRRADPFFARPDEAGERRTWIRPEDAVIADLGAALSRSRAGAGALLTLAEAFTRLPATAAALRAGRIDPARARVIAEHTADLPAEHARAVEERVLPRAVVQTPGQLGATTARAVLAVDPTAAARRHQRARAGRELRFTPAPNGMVDLYGHLTADGAAPLAAEIDRRARAMATNGDTRTLTQRRADALISLVDPSWSEPDQPDAEESEGRRDVDDPTVNGPTDDVATDDRRTDEIAERRADAAPDEGPRRGRDTTLVQIIIGASTLLGLDEAPAELAGYGPITPFVARALAARPNAVWQPVIVDSGGEILHLGPRLRAPADAPRFSSPGSGEANVEVLPALATDRRWKRMTVDPAKHGDPPGGGACRDDSDSPAERYRPSRHLAALIRLRDRTCRFPGCRMPALRCDLDHTVRFPDGRTVAINLGPFCRHHHLLKHRAGWRVRQEAGGRFTFIAPTGHIYTTEPEPLPGLEPPPPPVTWSAPDLQRPPFPPIDAAQDWTDVCNPPPTQDTRQGSTEDPADDPPPF